MDAELKTHKTKELGWKPTHDVKDFIEDLIGKS